MTHTMRGITFSPEQVRQIESKIPLPWVAADEVAQFIFDLYDMSSLTGEVIEISSGHKFSIWE